MNRVIFYKTALARTVANWLRLLWMKNGKKFAGAMGWERRWSREMKSRLLS